MTNLKMDKLKNINKKPIHLYTKSLKLANHFILMISSPHTTRFPADGGLNIPPNLLCKSAVKLPY